MNHPNTFRNTMLSALLMMSAGVAMAQAAPATGTATVPDHPRVNEVNERLANQQKRIDNGVASGKITEKQAAADEKRDANIARRESVDEAKHGGHLTKAEQNNLNKSLDKNSHRIRHQKQS